MEPAVRLDHVAIAVRDVAAAAPFLVGELGGRPAGAGPGLGFRFWQYEFARGGRIELLEPDGPPGGFLHRFLDKHGAGIHHVTFKVPVLGDAVRRAEAAGYEIVGFDDRFPGWKEAFLHPKQAQGIVVQLAESHPELEPDDLPFQPFPEAPPAADPVVLVGLRLACHGAERARRQWGEVLRGRERETAGGGLEFRWTDSPLRVHVEIAPPAAPERPLGIELAPRPGLALPEGPHAALGTVFVSTDPRRGK